MLKAKRRR